MRSGRLGAADTFLRLFIATFPSVNLFAFGTRLETITQGGEERISSFSIPLRLAIRSPRPACFEGNGDPGHESTVVVSLYGHDGSRFVLSVRDNHGSGNET